MGKWKHELITNSLKIISMKMDHLVFLDSVSFPPCALMKQPEAFGLQASKSWYPPYFNAEKNLDYVGTMPDIAYYGLDDMVVGEREEFLAWYEARKSRLFHNKQVLEAYC